MSPTLRIAAWCVGLLAGGAVPAAAQTFNHLSIEMEGRVINMDGGERLNTGSSSGGVVIGKTTSAAFSKMDDMCGFAVAGAMQPGAISGWKVDVTPTQVYASAVTFRLRWMRVRDESRDTSSPSGDVQLTLRPGESIPVDIIPLSPKISMPYEKCGVRATMLRVSVAYWPRPEQDPRVVSTELWLVERLSNGTERSQALTVRNGFNRETAFYFDPVTDGTLMLSFYGTFTLTPIGETYVMKLETWSRPSVPGQPSDSRLPTLRETLGGLYRARKVDSVLSLTPAEVVEVQLPRLAENSASAFAGSTFSIRVRAKQLR